MHDDRHTGWTAPFLHTKINGHPFSPGPVFFSFSSLFYYKEHMFFFQDGISKTIAALKKMTCRFPDSMPSFICSLLCDGLTAGLAAAIKADRPFCASRGCSSGRR
jgi:hypothetical protein